MIRGFLSVLFLLSTGACGGDGRPTSRDSGIYRFDAGPIGEPTDLGPSPADGGPPIDSGPRLGGEGEACGDDFDCEPNLACQAGTCREAGGDGQPCRALDVCDADLTCDTSGICRPFGMVRLCHCIYTTATMTPVDMEMQVGDTLLGPTPANLCTPCVPVPVGTDLPLEIRRTESGEVLQTGTLDVDGTVEPALGIIFSAGVFEAQVANCETVTGFCG